MQSQEVDAKAPVPKTSLTPAVRRDLLARALLAAIDEYVGGLVASHSANDDWVDQHRSPLGKRAHLEAVRGGRLPAVKHGKRILVRRADLEAYLATHVVRPKREVVAAVGADASHASEVAAEVLTSLGFRQRRK